MPTFTRNHVLVIVVAVAAVTGFAWPHSWAEVLTPSFLMPALGTIAAAVAGILMKAPEAPKE